MPGVGLIRSKLRPSRWLSPKSKQSFTKRRLLITASSKSFSARCANSVSKSSSDRHRESANAPAANIPKVPYLSAIPARGLVQRAQFQPPTGSRENASPIYPIQRLHYHPNQNVL